MKLLLLLFVAGVVGVVFADDESLVDIDVCIQGKDVIVITDIKAANDEQIQRLVDFFGDLANPLEEEGTRYYVLSYPLVHYNIRTREAVSTSTNVHKLSQVFSAQSMIKSSVKDRTYHPDINIALKSALKLLEGNRLRSNSEKVLLIFSYEKFVSPASYEKSKEEALETPRKQEMVKLADDLKDRADVLIYAIGTFENEFGLTDLASCRDDRCIFTIDDFQHLSKAPLYNNCD